MWQIWLFWSTITFSSPMPDEMRQLHLAYLLKPQMSGATLRPAWFDMNYMATLRHKNP